MVKKELIKKIADRAGISVSQADQAMNAFMETVSQELANGEFVRLTGFGTFETITMKEHKGRNPKTGEECIVKSARLPKFRAGAILKRSVAEPKKKTKKSKKK